MNLRIVVNAGGQVPRVIEDNVENFDDTSVKLYFVMDYIEGSTLEEYIKQHGPMDINSAVNLVINICKTVKIGHNENVLHRDIKPKNIMVAETNNNLQTTILDYGLSFNGDGIAEDLTKLNEQFRNEFFTLPETNVGNDGRRDPRTDYTAICGLLYYCLTGCNPVWLRDSNNNPPHKRTGQSMRDVLGENKMLPHLDALFNIGFAVNIDERFQSLGDIINRLQAILNTAIAPPVEDPRVAAARFSKLLIKNNRPVQLGEFNKLMKPVFTDVMQYVQNNYNTLGFFQVQSMGTGGFPVNMPLPQNIDDTNGQCLFIVRASHCQMGHIMVYKLGAIADEAIVFLYSNSGTEWFF